jgi:hypothetical protein
MNRKPLRTQESVLVILRDTLQRLELDPTAEIDAPLQAEFKRILRVRIANLEAQSAAMLRLVSIHGTSVPKPKHDERMPPRVRHILRES